jgi:hypothetical protein
MIEPQIFKDTGDMKPGNSLKFFEQVKSTLEGKIVKLMAERGTPEVIYNTRLYTDRKEEVWLSGFTCGKTHAGALGLCELIQSLNWKAVTREEIARIVLSNNRFTMEWKEDDPKKKLIVVLH